MIGEVHNIGGRWLVKYGLYYFERATEEKAIELKRGLDFALSAGASQAPGSHYETELKILTSKK